MRFNIELTEVNRMEYDYSKLYGKIVERYGTQARFAEAMGLSERSISFKLNGKVDWRQDEIMKACDLLRIKNSDIPAYFFTRKVQY
jgi:hypothetical protein